MLAGPLLLLLLLLQQQRANKCSEKLRQLPNGSCLR